MKSLDADVLGLQEVDRDQPRSFGADLTAVAAEAMGAVEHQFVAALAGTPGGTWMAATGEEQPGSATYGIALLSRLPRRLLAGGPAAGACGPPSRCGSRARGAGWVRDEPRVAVAAVLEGPSGEFTVCNTHLSFIPGGAPCSCAGWCARSPAPRSPWCSIGDLNMQQPQAARSPACARSASRDLPGHAPHRQIDHVLVRGGLRATGPAEAVPLPLSDHRALVVPCADPPDL